MGKYLCGFESQKQGRLGDFASEKTRSHCIRGGVIVVTQAEINTIELRCVEFNRDVSEMF